MSSPLDNLTAAHAAKLEAEAALVAAIRHARQNGETMQAIGDILGMTRAGVLYLLKRDGAHEPAAVTRKRRRLDELDERWNKLVDALEATMPHPDAQREQLYRNQINGKNKRKNARASAAARKRGFTGTSVGIPMRPTVKNETRKTAEAQLIRLVQDHLDDPRFVGIVAELAEANALRSELAASTDPSWLTD